MIDARPRIWPRLPQKMQPRSSLVDLEHLRLHRLMAPPADATAALGAFTWWCLPGKDALLTAVLQQQQPFRHQTKPSRVELCLLPDEEDQDADFSLHSVVGERGRPDLFIEIDKSKHARIADEDLAGPRIQPWAAPSYMAALADLAQTQGLSMRVCAQRFGKVQLPASNQGWFFHPVLGYAKRG